MKYSMPARMSLAGPIVALLLVASAGAAQAVDAEGNYAVWGVGQASCYQFGKAYGANDVAAFKAYLAGYLTAYNAIAEGVYQATGKNSVSDNLAAIAAHCASNPMDSFERAIQALIQASAQDKPAAGQAWGRAAPAAQ
mgnify:CR=1 FL=1